MKILYNSVHSILEYDELLMLTELGHDVYSLGAYTNGGKGHYLLPRPSVPGMKEHPEFAEYYPVNPKTNLPKEFFDKFDVIIDMHNPEFITENWDRMKHKKVVWRSIGQSTGHVENMIRRMHYEGMKIVRYSPMEQYIPNYLGSDAFIRFDKDKDEFTGWTGENKRAVNFTQSLKARRNFCHYDDIMKILDGFPATVYGGGNDDLGPLNGGELPYELMKGAMRDNRVFVYGGTWPACYTLSFMEALMTGIPVVAVGPGMAEQVEGIAPSERFRFYEVSDIIKNGENGFVSDDIGQLRAYLHELLEDHELAKRIGAEGRKTAIELFDKQKIKNDWKKFLEEI